jgi:hypothetical protein
LKTAIEQPRTRLKMLVTNKHFPRDARLLSGVECSKTLLLEVELRPKNSVYPVKWPAVALREWAMDAYGSLDDEKSTSVQLSVAMLWVDTMATRSVKVVVKRTSV